MNPVTGKVTLKDGQPLRGGQITFHPVDPPKDTKVGPSTGQINDSGEYALRTEGQAGAPSGKYKVTLSMPMVPQAGAKEMPKAPFDMRYQRIDTTPLQVDVPAGPFDFKLNPAK